MPFPFLFLALSLALGILFSSLLSFSLLSLVLSMIACLACAWLLYPLQKHKLSFLFVLFTTFLFGASLYTFSSRSFEENSLRKLKQTTYADFYGTLYKSPSFGIEKDYLFLKVKKVVYQNKEEKINGNLRITVPRSSEFPASLSLYTRDKVKVSARLLPYKNFQNFKTFSLDAYLKSQKIHNRASAKSPLLVEKIESGKKYSPIRLISVIRQKIQKKIKKHFSSPDTSSLSPQGAVLEALLLGERKRMEYQED